MIASPDCPCDTGPDVCCDTLWLKLDRIRTVAWNAVLDCDDVGCCQGREARTFVSINQDQGDPFGDSVFVTWIRTTPIVDTRNNHTPIVTGHRLEARVDLRVSGYPVLVKQGERAIPPTPTALNNAAKHVLGHGEKAYRAVVNAVQTHMLFPSTPGVIFKGQRVSDLVPVGPTAHIAGAAFLVNVDLAL